MSIPKTQSITDNENWPRWKKHFYKSADKSTTAIRTRWRIFVYDPPPDLRTFQMPCVYCSRLIHPVRQGKGAKNQHYFSPCCPQEITTVCSRNSQASYEYDKVIASLDKKQDDNKQLSLFGDK